MALPSGPSPIQTAVLQFSRDLQHAVSKAKTSISAVATQTCSGRVGSDSALPTSTEDTLTRKLRNYGTERVISSSTALLAAFDKARASSLPALPNSSEESSSQSGESDVRGKEDVLATTGKSKSGNVCTSPRRDAFHREIQTATSISCALRETEDTAKASVEVAENDGSDRHSCKSGDTERVMGQINRNVLSGGFFPDDYRRPAGASGVESGSEQESSSITGQTSLTSKRKKNPLVESNSSSTRWLNFASPPGSSASLHVARRSSTTSSSSLLSSYSCPRSSRKMSEHSQPARYTSQRPSLLENACPPLSIGDFQDVSPPYRHSANDTTAQQYHLHSGMSSSSRPQFQRKKLSAPLACCSVGSSPCGPPLLSAALLPAPQLQQQQQKVEKSFLHVVEGSEEDVLSTSKDNYPSSDQKYYKRSSYINRRSGGANPANSRLAEVENKWFFVDILSDAPSLVEETAMQQHCFSVADDSVDTLVSDILSKPSPHAEKAKDDDNCDLATSDSSNIMKGSPTLLLPRGSTAVDSSSGSSERVSVLASSPVVDNLTEEKAFVSASDCEEGVVPGQSLSIREKTKRLSGALLHSETHTDDAQQQTKEGLDQQSSEQCLVVPKQDSSFQLQVSGHLQQHEEEGGLASREKVMLQHSDGQPHEKVNQQADFNYRSLVQKEEQEEGVPLLLAADGSPNQVSLGGGDSSSAQPTIRRDNCISSSCSNTGQGATTVSNISAACSSEIIASSTFSSSHMQQWNSLYLLHSQQPRLQFSLRSLGSPELLNTHALPQEQQVVQQHEWPRLPMGVGAAGIGAGAALLRAAFRPSAERGGICGGTDVTSLGRRRHRMQKAEGTTSFASLEAMVEFVRNSISLYGTTALEGVTFHVPAHDAESLVAALEDTLPYSWRDLRSAALEALKPLTALVLGRFVLVQLPTLLMELAGGAAAENAAAAAATAAVEASGFSAVLSVAPWLIVFGGCVYAIVRGAQALQASRRAQFVIYDEGDTGTSLLSQQQHQQQQQQQHLRSGDVTFDGAGVTQAGGSASSQCVGRAPTSAPTTSTEGTTGLRAAATISTTPAGVAAESPPVEDTRHSPVAAVGNYPHTLTAVKASFVPPSEHGVMKALPQETLDSDVFSEVFTIAEEKHHSLQPACETEEENNRKTEVTLNAAATDLSSLRTNTNTDNRRRSSSNSSASIVDLLEVALSRRNSLANQEGTDIIEDAYNKCSAGEKELCMYGNSGVVLSCGKRFSESNGNTSANTNDRRTWMRSSSISSSICTSTTPNTQNSGSDSFNGSNVEKDSFASDGIPIVGADRNKSTSGTGVRRPSFADKPSLTSAAATAGSGLAVVFQDPHRPLQEEEALQHHLLTCSADWREKNFSFDV